MTGNLFDSSIASDAQGALSFITTILQASTEYSIIALGLDGTILLWNEGARRIYGYEPEEVVGKADSDLLYAPEAVRAGKPHEIMVIAQREGKWEGTLDRVRKNGEHFTARVVVTLHRAGSGQAIGFLVISKDITEEIRSLAELAERKRFERTLQEKNIELENANLAKDRFLASMSHELRTPLNAIIGFTGTLLMRLPGPLTVDQEKQLRTVQSSARHLLSLINDLLDLAKVESGKVELSLERLVCQSVIQEVATALRPSALSKGLRFEVLTPKEDMVIRTDQRALNQILLNLTNNAIKFTERGAVRIELRRRSDGERNLTEISVVDTGVGIRPEHQSRLFQAFTQVDAPYKSRQDGSGLGLHLSQKLAVLLGGRITFESEYGNGSTFTLAIEEQ